MNPKTLSGIIASLTVGIAMAARHEVEPQQSKLAFVGTQAGAEARGNFERFTADIDFDPKNLEHSKFDVSIDTKSVNTKDKERDGVIRGPDLFAADRFPTAHYAAEKFADQGGGKFSATGKLTLRDVTRVVPIDFTYEADGKNAWLKGRARLKRLDFGVGQGEWKDTEFVSNDVRIEFSLRLVPKI